MNCLIGAKHINRVTCPRCDHYDAPLFDGKVYLCRKCGADLGMTEQELPVKAAPPKPAESSSPAGPQRKCPYCAEVIPLEALVCSHCSSPLRGSSAHAAIPEARPSAVPTFLFAAGLLLSLGLASYALISSSETKRPEEEKPVSAAPGIDREGQWQRPFGDLNTELKKVSEQVGEMRANLPSSVARSVTDEVKGLSDQLDGRLERAETRIQSIEGAMRELSLKQAIAEKEKERKDAAVAAAPAAPRPEAVEASKTAEPDVSFAAFNRADDEAANFSKAFEYGKALGAFNNFITQYPGSPYVARALEKKKWYEASARQVYDEIIKVQAEALLKENKVDQALRWYERALNFGVPELVHEAQKECAKVASLKSQRTRDSIKFQENKEEVAAPAKGRGAGEVAETGGARVSDSTFTSGGAEDKRLPADVEQLVRLLEDEGTAAFQRKQVVKALADRRSPQSLAALVGALNDADWGVQLEAIKAVGRQGDLTVVDPLLGMLDHKMLPVQQAAAETLKILTGKDLGARKEDWKAWWTENRARLGIPQQEQSIQMSRSAGVPVAPAKDGRSALVLAVMLEKNSLIFKCDGLYPPPKEGETLSVVRGKQWLGKIEVTEIGPGIARAVIAEPLPGQTIQSNDQVIRD
ncbi:MAG: HEAT repeat domain-containing protein [Planctomycetes bacterium]|nr:HEAT repeat domain-containing protein [Planctomycetota bacterium]